MITVVDGLDFNSLMDMHFDVYMEVRKNVIEISNKRQSEIRSMKRA